MRRRWFGFVLASWLCVGAPAAAASLRVAPTWTCGETSELVFRVERRLGASRAQAPALHFDVSMERAGQELVALLGVAQAPGVAAQQRALRAADCESLSATVAVAVALALGEASAASVSEGAASESSAPLAPGLGGGSTGAVPARDAPPAAPAREPASQAPAFSLSAWLVADAGSLPAASLGAALAAEVGWPRLQLLALATTLFERSVELGTPVAPQAGATLGLASGALLACTPLVPSGAELAARLCLGGELGRLTAVGTGISDPRRGHVVWLAPRLDAALFVALPQTPLRIGTWLTAAMPLNRDELFIEAVGRVHQPPRVVGRVALGAELRF